jgi:NAD(P)-dependent dehydrogenase (short-subunit alcohol dehydrogenase family)
VEVGNAIALVTGGASGLGRAAAHRLSASGARVVIADLPDTQAHVEAEFGGRVEFAATDVTDESAIAAAVRTASGLGPLRVLVACAGIADQGRLLGSRGPVDLRRVRHVMDVNFVGAVGTLAHAADAMQHNEPLNGDRGVAVLVSSAAGLDSSSVSYGGSKAAVAGIALAAARELAGRAIRVAAVAPGVFDTEMVAGMSTAAVESLGRPAHPPRRGAAEEFAGLVQHIIENPMINGEVIRLDAALRAPARIR